MGFWSGTGKVMGQIVDVRVDQWFGVEGFKQQTAALVNSVKDITTVEHATREETFEQAMARLNLTEAIVEQRKRQYSILVHLFLTVALLVFIYGVYLAYIHSWSGVCLALSLTVYSLSQAFRYDFWVFQFKQRRLGCTVKEWWSS